MILDRLENAHQYFAINKGFEKAFNFLSRNDLKELPVDRYKIDGESVYAMISKDYGRKKEVALLETHEKYIDIQLVLDGTDNMGWKPKASCIKPSSKYNSDTDVQFFTDDPDSWVKTKKGAFIIFFPKDAHMPLISSEQLHKVVVKVAIK